MSWPASLSSRLVLTLVGLVGVTALLIGTVTAVAMRGYLYDRLDDQVTQSMDRLARAPSAPPEDAPPGDGVPLGPGPGLGTAVGTVVGLFPAEGTDLGFVIGMRSDNRAYRKTLSTSAMQRLEDVPADGEVHGVDLPALGGYRVAARAVDGGTVVTGLPTTDVGDTLASLIWWELLLGLAGVGAAGAAGTFWIRRQLRPLTEVAATAHAVAAMPLESGEIGVTQRVPHRLTDERTEVGQVGSALNRLLEHVETSLAARHRSEQQVRQFVADASHELRTPLSTIRGYSELSRRTPEDPAALSTALTKVETETRRMGTLVDDLLLLARLDAGRPLDRAEVDITHLLLESVGDARVLSPEHHWQLRLPGDPLTVTGDEQRLHQAVTNLLGNARHHTPSGSTITTAADAVDGWVRVTVHDDGPGLPAALGSHAFQRFARGDTSRARASGGAGLGLSLVDAIARAHGGAAAVDSRPGDTTFTITLPR